MMKAGSDSNGNSANVSHNDWCLQATINGPRGILSSPRNSTLVSQITRSSQRLLRAQNFATAMMAARGITSVGNAAMSRVTRFR